MAEAVAKGELLYKELTADIIVAALAVHNTLGCGLLEKVYENALVWELTLRKHKVLAQQEFRVTYRDKEVGVYYADLVVDGREGRGRS
jgi:GxxExxY protein